jgi:hypothetical protein
MVPWVVSAVKSGAVSLILKDMLHLLQSLALNFLSFDGFLHFTPTGELL